jgi:ABC-2 type transport system permease protein
MLRYILLWFQFLKMSWMADMEYRLNFVVRIFGELVWYTAQLSIFEVLFTHTNSLYGWDIHSIRVFMGTIFLVDVFNMIFLHENMDYISSLVRKGDLDLYLVKPINSQFMVTMRKVSVAYIFNMFLIFAYLLWGISGLNHPVSVGQVLLYILMVLVGVLIFYSVRFLFAMIVIILQEAGNIQFVWYQIFRLGTRPDILYPRFLRLMVLTLLPVGFFASVPSRILVEGISFELIAAGLFIALVSFFLSSFLWKRALRSYSSASS